MVNILKLLLNKTGKFLLLLFITSYYNCVYRIVHKNGNGFVKGEREKIFAVNFSITAAKCRRALKQETKFSYVCIMQYCNYEKKVKQFVQVRYT